MTNAKKPRRRRSPAPRKNEVIGGGFFVFRRGKKTGRVAPGSSLPYEHGSFEQALAEATRLAKLCPGETYEVFQTSVAIATSNEALFYEMTASDDDAAKDVDLIVFDPLLERLKEAEAA